MAKVIKAPFKPGEIFDLPLKVLAPRAGETDQAAEANYRRRTSTETLEELAQSIHELGQLQPVLVWWTGEGWALGAGYRRVLAMALEAERYGFKQVECKAVEREKAALVRLAENLQREDPSSYDTSEYLFRLSTGQIDGVKHTPTEIGQHLGKSARHVANLIRFFRETPEYVRAAWRNDSAGRFTFSRLNELATLAAKGTIVGPVEVARVLGLPFGGRADAAPAPSEAAPSEAAPSPSEPASAPRSSAPEAPADGSSLGRGRRLGRRGAKRLAEQLADGISVARLQDDDRAVVLRDALLVMAGDAEPELIRGHVERVRRDLGVSDAP